MPILDNWTVAVDVDAVLRNQGADPAAIRARSPRLVQVAQRALNEALPLLACKVLYQHLAVNSLRHEKLCLAGGKHLSGTLLTQHLAGAEGVILVLCTIGDGLEGRAGEISNEDIVYCLALEGVGSAYVEALANAAYASLEAQAREAGLQTSIPLSPGMVGWPVEHGQPQIFSILDPLEIGVRLSPSMLMSPRKSLTFVLGVGAEMIDSGGTCDYCGLKDTCIYKDHHGLCYREGVSPG
jgi:hypothetical protein